MRRERQRHQTRQRHGVHPHGQRRWRWRRRRKRQPGRPCARQRVVRLKTTRALSGPGGAGARAATWSGYAERGPPQSGWTGRPSLCASSDYAGQGRPPAGRGFRDASLDPDADAGANADPRRMYEHSYERLYSYVCPDTELGRAGDDGRRTTDGDDGLERVVESVVEGDGVANKAFCLPREAQRPMTAVSVSRVSAGRDPFSSCLCRPWQRCRCQWQSLRFKLQACNITQAPVLAVPAGRSCVGARCSMGEVRRPPERLD